MPSLTRFFETQNAKRSEYCSTRGVVNSVVRTPKLVLLTSDSPIREPAASKRTEFVMLNASQANLIDFCSLRFHTLDKPASIPKYPGPRKLLRCPASPA